MSDIPTTTAVGELGDGFVSGTGNVNGTVMHYVRGGRGPTVVLIHGFSQDWYEWRRIMPRLAKRFTVVAIDLPGIGGSMPSADGYAAPDLARDVHQLVDGLDLGASHLVGHDIGAVSPTRTLASSPNRPGPSRYWRSRFPASRRSSPWRSTLPCGTSPST